MGSEHPQGPHDHFQSLTARHAEQVYLDARQLAPRLGMTRKAVYAAEKRGDIPGHRLGRRRLLFFWPEVVEALQRRGR